MATVNHIQTVRKRRDRKPKVDTDTIDVDNNNKPKKRGRKPKPKTPEEIEALKNRVPKKRGRKPKIKTPEEIEALKNRVPKKRGRKPKSLTLTVTKMPEKPNMKEDDEIIIISLPITKNDIPNIEHLFFEEKFYTYQKLVNFPQPRLNIDTDFEKFVCDLNTVNRSENQQAHGQINNIHENNTYRDDKINPQKLKKMFQDRINERTQGDELYRPEKNPSLTFEESLSTGNDNPIQVPPKYDPDIDTMYEKYSETDNLFVFNDISYLSNGDLNINTEHINNILKELGGTGQLQKNKQTTDINQNIQSEYSTDIQVVRSSENFSTYSDSDILNPNINLLHYTHHELIEMFQKLQQFYLNKMNTTRPNVNDILDAYEKLNEKQKQDEENVNPQKSSIEEDPEAIYKAKKYKLYHESDEYKSFCNVRSFTICNIFVDKYNIKKWPKSTTICCWWDTEPFKGPPIPCVRGYDSSNDRFRVYGCFCSFNCACAYDQTNKEHGNRSSLFVFFYRRITGDKSIKNIKSALPRESLIKFGGPFTIEKFREKSVSIVLNYRLIEPPLMAYNIYVEETRTISVEERKYHESKKDTEDKPLRLKRSKPLPNQCHNLRKFFDD